MIRLPGQSVEKDRLQMAQKECSWCEVQSAVEVEEWTMVTLLPFCCARSMDDNVRAFIGTKTVSTCKDIQAARAYEAMGIGHGDDMFTEAFCAKGVYKRASAQCQLNACCMR